MKQEIFDFIQATGYAVVSTVTPEGLPEAALVAIAASPDLELVFDTVDTTRKYANLMAKPSIALVIGFGDEKTVQCEGEAAAPGGADLERYREIYFRRWPDGRIETIVHDPRLLWPDTLSVANGWVYVTANQLHRGKDYNGGHDMRVKPYSLFRFKIDAGPVQLKH